MRTPELNEEYLKHLNALKKAWADLVVFYLDKDTSETEYHLIGMRHFPFEQSFDEYLQGLKNWIKAVEVELSNLTCPNCNEEDQKGNYCSNCGEPL